MIIYMIMAMSDSNTDNKERIRTLFETVEVNMMSWFSVMVLTHNLSLSDRASSTSQAVTLAQR
jgi:hypothetical protein